MRPVLPASACRCRPIDFFADTQPRGVPVTRPNVHRTDGNIDAIDVVTARHHQVQGILESLAMSFDTGDAVPITKMAKHTIWAAQELLTQAEEALNILFSR